MCKKKGQQFFFFRDFLYTHGNCRLRKKLKKQIEKQNFIYYNRKVEQMMGVVNNNNTYHEM
jgi:hypothetical protein